MRRRTGQLGLAAEKVEGVLGTAVVDAPALLWETAPRRDAADDCVHRSALGLGRRPEAAAEALGVAGVALEDRHAAGDPRLSRSRSGSPWPHYRGDVCVPG